MTRGGFISSDFLFLITIILKKKDSVNLFMPNIERIIEDVECPILNKKWMEENNRNSSPGLKAQIQFVRHKHDDPIKDTDLLPVKFYCLYDRTPDKSGLCSAGEIEKPCIYKH